VRQHVSDIGENADKTAVLNCDSGSIGRLEGRASCSPVVAHRGRRRRFVVIVITAAGGEQPADSRDGQPECDPTPQYLAACDTPRADLRQQFGNLGLRLC
jgi:hypothetical protein